MKTVITGGAGFIGSHTVEEFLRQGWDVTVIDSLESGDADHVHPQAKLIKHDIRKDSVIQVIQDEMPKIIVHLAAQSDVQRSLADPGLDAMSNVVGTVHMLEACRRTKSKIVLASTAGVYGDLDKYPIEETDPLSPKSYYALSKKVAEEYIRMYSEIYNIPYIILRYANVYGPRQKPKGEGGVVAVFLNRLAENEPIHIFGDGLQTRDFVYVKDVARANYLAALGMNEQTLHVSTGVRTTVQTIADTLRSLFPHPAPVSYKPARVGEVKDSCLDNSRIADMLQWRPNVSLHEGLAETYDYVMSQHTNYKLA